MCSHWFAGRVGWWVWVRFGVAGMGSRHAVGFTFNTCWAFFPLVVLAVCGWWGGGSLLVILVLGVGGGVVGCL